MYDPILRTTNNIFENGNPIVVNAERIGWLCEFHARDAIVHGHRLPAGRMEVILLAVHQCLQCESGDPVVKMQLHPAAHPDWPLKRKYLQGRLDQNLEQFSLNPPIQYEWLLTLFVY